MIVLGIIGILVVLVILAFKTQLFKGNDAKRKGDIDRIKIAVEEYEKDHNCYPQYIVCGIHSDQPVYPYLNNVPCDPITHASYVYTNDGSAVCPKWFKVYTVLENVKDLSTILGIGPGNAYNYVQGSGNAPTDIAVEQTAAPSATPYGSSGSPTPAPSGQDDFYGCKSGVCVPISWDSDRPGPECDPNYQNSSCYGQCSLPNHECVDWR